MTEIDVLRNHVRDLEIALERQKNRAELAEADLRDARDVILSMKRDIANYREREHTMGWNQE